MFRNPAGKPGRRWKRGDKRKFRRNVRRVRRFLKRQPGSPTWWGRTNEQMLLWERMAHNTSYKEDEGPKKKYEGIYKRHFMKKDPKIKDEEGKYLDYLKAKDFIKCEP